MDEAEILAAEFPHDRGATAVPFTAALHPDDAIARCAEILDNMHGSDDQRRKVVAALVERFAPA